MFADDSPPPRSKRSSGNPTIADVARRAGVGAMTVSRALREPERVSAVLRAQIAEAVAELGYVPNRNARALAAARTDLVAVLIPSLANNVFSEVVRGLYSGLGDSHLQIQLGNTHYSETEEERLIRLFAGQRPAGLVVTGTDQTAAARALLAEAGCPVVQIMELGSDPVDMMVGFSHFEAGRAATRHLIEAGYRRIGFIGARMDPRSQRRLAGYRAELEQAGLFEERLVTTTTIPSSVSLGRELLRDALERVPDLDALFCNNDDIAMGVLFECHHAAIPVPERLGLVGFNDHEMMAAACPPVTSVRTPRFEMGLRAMEMLRATMAGRPPSASVVDLGFTLQLRESSRRG